MTTLQSVHNTYVIVEYSSWHLPDCLAELYPSYTAAEEALTLLLLSDNNKKGSKYRVKLLSDFIDEHGHESYQEGRRDAKDASDDGYYC